MKFKVYFLSNARSVVEADNYAVDDELLVFIKDDKPVLTCVLTNITCFCADDETAPVPLVAQVGGFPARI